MLSCAFLRCQIPAILGVPYFHRSEHLSLTVLQVLPALDVGGVEQGTVEVARELVRKGHRAIVVAAPGRKVQELIEAGAEYISWPIGEKSPMSLRFIVPLRRLMRERHVDILHMRSRMPAWVSYLAWRRMDMGYRPRLVTTVHGPYTVNRYSAVMVKGERIIAVSRMIRDYILSNYPFVNPEQIELIHRGVDPSIYPFGYRPSAKWLEEWHRLMPQLQNRFVITLPARITRWKGQEDFIELIRALKARSAVVHGLVVGGADSRRQSFLEELRSRTAATGLSGDITFLGNRADMREILSVSNLAVSLSREPEAFGRTTLEALSLGVPLVGYNHGGVAEILEAIFPAGRIPVGNVGAMAEKILSFIDTRPILLPPADFTLQRMLDQTLSLYESLAQ